MKSPGSPVTLLQRKSLRRQTIVPNSRPIPAVGAIASAPQNVTRHAPATAGAPPVSAAAAPSTARNTNELAATPGISAPRGSASTTRSGSAAPTVKLAADASAVMHAR